MNHLLKKTKLFLLAALLSATGFLLFAQPAHAEETFLGTTTTISCKGRVGRCASGSIRVHGKDPVVVITKNLSESAVVYTQK